MQTMDLLKHFFRFSFQHCDYGLIRFRHRKMFWLKTPALVATNTAERFPTPLQNDPVFVTIKTAGNCPYVSFKNIHWFHSYKH